MRLTGSLLRRLSPLLRRQAFRLQSQMDIHPRSLWHNPGFRAQDGRLLSARGPDRALDRTGLARGFRPAATCWSF